jgi:hypothetical protein
VVAAQVSELRDTCLTQLLLAARDISRSKLDPGSSECGRVVHRASIVISRSKVGELNAECTAIAKRHQQDWVRKAEVQFDGVAPEDISEESGKAFTLLGPYKQVYSGAKGSYSLLGHAHRSIPQNPAKLSEVPPGSLCPGQGFAPFSRSHQMIVDGRSRMLAAKRSGCQRTNIGILLE